MTTVFYPEQIGAYRIGDPDLYSTTPTNFKLNKTDFLLDPIFGSGSSSEDNSIAMPLRSDESFLSPPLNHRRQYSEERLHTYGPNELRPSGFKFRNESTKQLAFPQIPKDYVGRVNSISDILEQVRSSGMPDAMTSNHGIRIQGTYRQKKNSETHADHPDVVMGLSSVKNWKHHSPAATVLHSNHLVSDPLYPYKPATLGDINLMAVNKFRFAPFVHHTKPKAMKVSSQSSDPETVYKQILAASENHLTKHSDISRNELTEKRRKPFSLMLDVYPMNEDENAPTTKRPAPEVFKKPPPKPVDVNAINNNLQYDQSYYNQIQFPQLQPYRVPHMHQFYDDMYFRRYLALKQNPFWNRNPYQTQSQSHRRDRMEPPQKDASSTGPGQITVHLNLFPHRKDKVNKVKNVEILGRSEETRSTLFPVNDHTGSNSVSQESLEPGIRKLETPSATIHIPSLLDLLPAPLHRNQSSIAPQNATTETTTPTIESGKTTPNIIVSKVKAEMPTSSTFAHTTFSVPISNASRPFRLPNGHVERTTLFPMKPQLTLGPPTIRSMNALPDITTPVTHFSDFKYPTMTTARTPASMFFNPTLEPIFIPTPRIEGITAPGAIPYSTIPTAFFGRNDARMPRYRNVLLPAKR